MAACAAGCVALARKSPRWRRKRKHTKGGEGSGVACGFYGYLDSWRSERRSRTTVRSAALPNSPTPTAWWPSGGQRTSIVCSRASSPRPSLWCTRPSPAAVSSDVCVWVSQVEDNEGGSGTSQTFNYTLGGDLERPKNFQAFFYSLGKLQNE